MNIASKISYSLLGGVLKGLARLPFGVLYAISDFLYILIYRVVRYRVKIARNNIRTAFPHKSEKECREIERKFYKHFADYIVETIKLLHITDEEMRRRMQYFDVSLVDESLSKGKSSAIYAGHYANWEWLPSITLWSAYSPEAVSFGQIYRPLKNVWFDEFLLKLRGRFHSVCIAKSNSLRHLLKDKINGKLTVTGFISDQHPAPNDNKHVLRFLNHDTAFITGSELIAQRLGLDVYYFDVEKIKRGYYTTTIRKITCNAAEQTPGAITDAYVALLEKSIERQPELWLWTHARWKNPVGNTPHSPISIK